MTGLNGIVEYDGFSEKVSDMRHGYFCVGYSEKTNDPHAPLSTSDPTWWNILTFGTDNRCVQIAIQTYFGSTTNVLFIRKQHDNDAFPWILIK